MLQGNITIDLNDLMNKIRHGYKDFMSYEEVSQHSHFVQKKNPYSDCSEMQGDTLNVYFYFETCINCFKIISSNKMSLFDGNDVMRYAMEYSAFVYGIFCICFMEAGQKHC